MSRLCELDVGDRLFWKVREEGSTHGHLTAGAIVVDLHVVVLGPAAQLRVVQAEAALTVHLAVRRPGLVVVSAHLRSVE